MPGAGALCRTNRRTASSRHFQWAAQVSALLWKRLLSKMGLQRLLLIIQLPNLIVVTTFPLCPAVSRGSAGRPRAWARQFRRLCNRDLDRLLGRGSAEHEVSR
eukprot:8269204-Pyramimonas_sp.AAC.1